REGNLLIRVYRKSGTLGVCPCQRYSQSALYHGVWIGRIQIRRVWIGQGRNNAVHVEDQVRATGWEYGPGVELGNQGNAPYGPNQGVQIFQGEARKIGRDRSPCQELQRNWTESPPNRKQRWLRRNRTACHPPAGA